jgi:amino acid transporter
LNNTEEPTLRRELGLRDLTLFSIAVMVGTRWLPAAAHAGPGSITLWLLAAFFFAVPLAIATAVLTVKYPGAGGLYLWTRNDFGPWHGFLAFWIYWMGIAFWFPSAAMFYMSTSAYMFGPAYAPLADSRSFVLIASLIAIWIALGTNLVGMKIGKWTENLGGIATWTIGALLIGFGAIVWVKRGSATHMNIMPHWNWGTVNFWASIAYAMSGIELAGIMGSEIRDPERTLPRAAALASLFATVFYACTTMALLVFLAPEKISELNGLAQGGEVVSQVLHIAWITPMFALLVLATAIGGFGGMGAAVSRMPFAAGVDSLLPAAFGKIHPRWGTPHISILVLGVLATFLLVVIQFGDTMRAAYQELVSLMVIADRRFSPLWLHICERVESPQVPHCH